MLQPVLEVLGLLVISSLQCNFLEKSLYFNAVRHVEVQLLEPTPCLGIYNGGTRS